MFLLTGNLIRLTNRFIVRRAKVEMRQTIPPTFNEFPRFNGFTSFSLELNGRALRLLPWPFRED